MSAKSILVNFALGGMSMLIPKKRGDGFLKVPLGHHASELSTYLIDNFTYEFDGLDGCIAVQTGYVHPDREQYFLDTVAAPIAKHLAMEFRRVEDKEYWQLHPLAHLLR